MPNDNTTTAPKAAPYEMVKPVASKATNRSSTAGELPIADIVKALLPIFTKKTSPSDVVKSIGGDDQDGGAA